MGCCATREGMQVLIRQISSKQIFQRIYDKDFLMLAVRDAVNETERAKGHPVYILEAYRTFKRPPHERIRPTSGGCCNML